MMEFDVDKPPTGWVAMWLVPETDAIFDLRFKSVARDQQYVQRVLAGALRKDGKRKVADSDWGFEHPTIVPSSKLFHDEVSAWRRVKDRELHHIEMAQSSINVALAAIAQAEQRVAELTGGENHVRYWPQEMPT